MVELAYTTQTGDEPGWKRFPAEPLELDPHALCVHSVGYCDADWD